MCALDSGQGEANREQREQVLRSFDQDLERPGKLVNAMSFEDALSACTGLIDSSSSSGVFILVRCSWHL